MAEDKKEILKRIANYAEEILRCQPICRFYYHNIDHTRSVVEKVEFLAGTEGLTDEELFILKAAAWFHDLGYINSYNNHEDESIRIAREFFKNEDMDAATVGQIVSRIDATRVPQKARSLPDRIIADADLFDLGTDDFFRQSDNLFKEWNTNIRPMTESEFWKMSYDFVEKHRFLTTYGKKKLEPKKRENLRMVKELLDKLKKDSG